MKTKFILLAIFFITVALQVLANPPEEGKTIFITQCAACHNVNKVMTGPALAGVDQRRSIDWVIKFVQSSRSLIKSGDKTAMGIFEEFNKVPMPDHPHLTADNIKSIIEYIKSEARPANESDAPFAKPGKRKSNYLPLTIQKDYWFFIGYLLTVGMLIITLLLVVQLKGFKNKHLNQETPV